MKITRTRIDCCQVPLVYLFFSSFVLECVAAQVALDRGVHCTSPPPLPNDTTPPPPQLARGCSLTIGVPQPFLQTELKVKTKQTKDPEKI